MNEHVTNVEFDHLGHTEQRCVNICAASETLSSFHQEIYINNQKLDFYHIIHI